MILRYDFDWGSLKDSICSTSMQCVFFLNMNKVSHYIWLDVFKSSINISNVNARFFNKFVSIVNTHGDYDLFVWRPLCSHVDARLQFVFTTNDFLDKFDFLFWRLEKASLIFNISLAVLDPLYNAWAYDFFWVEEGFFLKYLEISFTSLGDFTGMEGGRVET